MGRHRGLVRYRPNQNHEEDEEEDTDEDEDDDSVEVEVDVEADDDVDLVNSEDSVGEHGEFELAPVWDNEMHRLAHVHVARLLQK